GEERYLREARLVPRRPAGRARLEDRPPVAERPLAIAEPGRRARRSAHRLGSARVASEDLLVEPPCSRRVAGSEIEVGERNSLALLATLLQEDLVHAPGEREGGAPFGLGGALGARS